MKLSYLLAFGASTVLALDKPLNIEVTHPVECTRKTARGDKVDVHYRGTLQADGTEFDASYNRGQPLSFHVGKGQVIKGWDEGLLDMCPGEKRTLTIQPEWVSYLLPHMRMLFSIDSRNEECIVNTFNRVMASVGWDRSQPIQCLFLRRN